MHQQRLKINKKAHSENSFPLVRSHKMKGATASSRPSQRTFFSFVSSWWKNISTAVNFYALNGSCKFCFVSKEPFRRTNSDSTKAVYSSVISFLMIRLCVCQYHHLYLSACAVFPQYITVFSYFCFSTLYPMSTVAIHKLSFPLSSNLLKIFLYIMY